MTPQAAARRFVDLVLGFRFSDVLDLIEISDDERPDVPKATRAAYARVESAIRQHGRYTGGDPSRLFLTAVRAVSEGRTAAALKALERFENASIAELSVAQQAAYLIGCEVGRSLWKGGVE